MEGLWRHFSDHHLLALRAYRSLAAAVGPVEARLALRQLRLLPPDEAAALISSFHVSLARQRDDALAAQQALALIGAESGADVDALHSDSMTITELIKREKQYPPIESSVVVHAMTIPPSSGTETFPSR